jgi:putative ABC transport system permease protein
MKAVLRLAALSAWSRRLTLGLTLLAIALAVTLLLAVERIRSDARQSFTQSVVGRGPGGRRAHGGVQLMLYAVFHSGTASNNMRWDSYRDARDPPGCRLGGTAVAGRRHRGFPVLGTSPTISSASAWRPAGACAFAGQALRRGVRGGPRQRGGGAARLPAGDKHHALHGMAEFGPEHGDKPFRVVGILAPTGTPVDRTVHVSLEAITAMHLDWVGGAPLPGGHPAEFVAEIRFATEGNHRRAGRPQAARRCLPHAALHQRYRGEPLLAVMPGVALDELWQTARHGRAHLLLALSRWW